MQTRQNTMPSITFMGQTVETGGALFNRKDQRNAADEVVPILDRNGEARREGVHDYWFNNGPHS